MLQGILPWSSICHLILSSKIAGCSRKVGHLVPLLRKVRTKARASCQSSYRPTSEKRPNTAQFVFHMKKKVAMVIDKSFKGFPVRRAGS